MEMEMETVSAVVKVAEKVCVLGPAMGFQASNTGCRIMVSMYEAPTGQQVQGKVIQWNEIRNADERWVVDSLIWVVQLMSLNLKAQARPWATLAYPLNRSSSLNGNVKG